VVGARFTQAFAGRRLAASARAALTKIEAVLPEALRERSERSRILAPVVPGRDELRGRLDALHAAIDGRRVVRLAYESLGGSPSARDVEPLCLAFWGQAWTLGAWCRLRTGFRNFRLDRVRDLVVLDEVAPDDPERALRAYLRSVGAGPDFEI
jgi:predicted DNA-binding transcriptional regulator YafY